MTDSKTFDFSNLLTQFNLTDDKYVKKGDIEENISKEVETETIIIEENEIQDIENNYLNIIKQFLDLIEVGELNYLGLDFEATVAGNVNIKLEEKFENKLFVEKTKKLFNEEIKIADINNYIKEIVKVFKKGKVCFIYYDNKQVVLSNFEEFLNFFEDFFIQNYDNREIIIQEALDKTDIDFFKNICYNQNNLFIGNNIIKNEEQANKIYDEIVKDFENGIIDKNQIYGKNGNYITSKEELELILKTEYNNDKLKFLKEIYTSKPRCFDFFGTENPTSNLCYNYFKENCQNGQINGQQIVLYQNSQLYVINNIDDFILQNYFGKIITKDLIRNIKIIDQNYNVLSIFTEDTIEKNIELSLFLGIHNYLLQGKEIYYNEQVINSVEKFYNLIYDEIVIKKKLIDETEPRIFNNVYFEEVNDIVLEEDEFEKYKNQESINIEDIVKQEINKIFESNKDNKFTFFMNSVDQQLLEKMLIEFLIQQFCTLQYVNGRQVCFELINDDKKHNLTEYLSALNEALKKGKPIYSMQTQIEDINDFKKILLDKLRSTLNKNLKIIKTINIFKETQQSTQDMYDTVQNYFSQSKKDKKLYYKDTELLEITDFDNVIKYQKPVKKITNYFKYKKQYIDYSELSKEVEEELYNERIENEVEKIIEQRIKEIELTDKEKNTVQQQAEEEWEKEKITQEKEIKNRITLKHKNKVENEIREEIEKETRKEIIKQQNDNKSIDDIQLKNAIANKKAEIDRRIKDKMEKKDENTEKSVNDIIEKEIKEELEKIKKERIHILFEEKKEEFLKNKLHQKDEYNKIKKEVEDKINKQKETEKPQINKSVIQQKNKTPEIKVKEKMKEEKKEIKEEKEEIEQDLEEEETTVEQPKTILNRGSLKDKIKEITKYAKYEKEEIKQQIAAGTKYQDKISIDQILTYVDQMFGVFENRDNKIKDKHMNDFSVVIGSTSQKKLFKKMKKQIDILYPDSDNKNNELSALIFDVIVDKYIEMYNSKRQDGKQHKKKYEQELNYNNIDTSDHFKDLKKIAEIFLGKEKKLENYPVERQKREDRQKDKQKEEIKEVKEEKDEQKEEGEIKKEKKEIKEEKEEKIKEEEPYNMSVVIEKEDEEKHSSSANSDESETEEEEIKEEKEEKEEQKEEVKEEKEEVKEEKEEVKEEKEEVKEEKEEVKEEVKEKWEYYNEDEVESDEYEYSYEEEEEEKDLEEEEEYELITEEQEIEDLNERLKDKNIKIEKFADNTYNIIKTKDEQQTVIKITLTSEEQFIEDRIKEMYKDNNFKNALLHSQKIAFGEVCKALGISTEKQKSGR